MRDFTLEKYRVYLEAIKRAAMPFFRYDEFMEAERAGLDQFCLVRHDVDRKPKLALDMAQLERELGIKATYYFRAKKCSFDKVIIKEIAALGHEVGYHYESLSDTDGDIEAALIDFTKNLNDFRAVTQIKTCSMHGRPFKPYDNRDIWKVKKNHEYLINELGLLGEVYLDIDYSDIAYINDTGRNWTSGKSNVRDKVDSNIKANFNSSEELLAYLSKPHPKLVFQIHPERWSDNQLEWFVQNCKDSAINAIKKILN